MGLEFKSQIATTREQSEKLLALGLKPETADMYWCDDGLSVSDWGQINSFRCYPPEDNTDEFYPSWSLSRLLELLPVEVPDPEPFFDPHHPELIILDKGYSLSMRRYSADCLVGTHIEDSPIECCVSMIGWLIRNKHFNKGYLK